MRTKEAQTEKLLFLSFFLLPLLYAIYTGHVWEDYYITYKHSKNLAAGVGLQYEAGLRLHGFTSPLGVLIPALIAAVPGFSADASVLWMFRVVCALFFAGAGVLCFRILRLLAVPGGLALCILSLLLFDIKSVDFSMNGMETALLLFFIALSIYRMLLLPERPWLLGLAWAGLLWSRPDGCIYIAALAVAFFCFAPRQERILRITQYVKAAAVCALAYLPWFLWAWSYYSTPVPHTILAKSGANSAYLQMMKLLNLPFKFLPGIPELEFSGHGVAENIQLFLLAPSYLFTRLTATYSLFVFLGVLSFVCFAKLSEQSRERKAVALSGLIMALYLYLIPSNYPWYIPGCALFFILSLASVLEWSGKHLPVWGGRVLVFLLVGLQVSIFAGGSYFNKIRQLEIEENHRKQIGLWLADYAEPGSSVFLECLGYIGYFSNLKMLDYPGLVAPAVVEARKRVGPYMSDVIKTLKPDFLVLRPKEARRVHRRQPGLLDTEYRLVRTFDARERLAAYRWIPWRFNIFPDAQFGVFQRLKQKPQATAPRG